MKNMARSNGLSTFTSSNIRSFNSTINILNIIDKYDLFNTIKDYYENYEKPLFIPCLSDENFFCREEKTFKNCVRIHGIISKEDINDNDVFEQIYSFLEYIFISLKLPYLTFVFKGFNDEKIYNIKPNDKKQK
jgi:hypothetical protein